MFYGRIVDIAYIGNHEFHLPLISLQHTTLQEPGRRNGGRSHREGLDFF
jgi:hypothetical protein